MAALNGKKAGGLIGLKNGRKPNRRGRDPATGRFLRGNPGGPGRPTRATEEEYLVTLREECPLESWRKVIQRSVTDAVHGEPRARDFLAKYVLPAGGTPLEAPGLAHDAQHTIARLLPTMSIEELDVLDRMLRRVEEIEASGVAARTGEATAGAEPPR
jgi:hypothetical protein